jgi:hypothetical protein
VRHWGLIDGKTNRCILSIEYVRPFTENSALNNTLLQYELPVVSYTTIESDGYGKFSTSEPLFYD